LAIEKLESHKSLGIDQMSAERIKAGGKTIHNMKIDNSHFERVEEFKYFGITLTKKILFRKKLRADRSQGMLAIFRCKIFCLPVWYPKILRIRHTEI